jgi:ectoine hydroxylase
VRVPSWPRSAGTIAAPAGRAGSLVLFECDVMHGSNGNITPDTRSNVFFVYNGVENVPEAPFAARHPRPDFIATREVCPIVPDQAGPAAPSRYEGPAGAGRGRSRPHGG